MPGGLEATGRPIAGSTGRGAPCHYEGVPVTRLRVLLSEASSLTAREHLTVLGMAGMRMEAMSSDSFAFAAGAARPGSHAGGPVEPPDTYDL